MKRLVLNLVMIIAIVGAVNAKNITKREMLNIEEKTFSTIFLNTKIPTKIFFPRKEPKNAVIQFVLNKTKSEKKYFEKIN
ncbi:MAG: hypothetical protein Q9M36_03770 [Sulfurovum sp.]|nr:hypothetical protein [Sulfurovum sp.]